ncbi:ABC transporter ATP-binding protein [Limoniibacter endophyticus]|uniref:ABC transporter ATP-binding protein n=1 Tax=Limoniibacter endophyticus TaxID=1565040 RepID=A0A8J3DSK2_9HYPH|nr:ABC transporter ATP-binding protein [Limoniibacter endophyticus]GHC80109.1 ABC transporter ATP-binding protein [Limoniibacter endophyticus]
MSALLETRGLSISFGALKAVDNIDFSLQSGEIHALIGPNGAGKTSFVNLLSGRLMAESGEVLFDGRNLTRQPAYRRVRAGLGYTFQVTSIFAQLTVQDNVRLALERERSASAAEILSLLKSTGLEAHAFMPARDLAYGHQRLLELTMGLALRPKLLMLDEPTQGLADSEIEGFIALIREVSKTTTILLIEHNMQVVMALADRITVLERGRILAQGSPAEIRASEAVQAAYLGSKS